MIGRLIWHPRRSVQSGGGRSDASRKGSLPITRYVFFFGIEHMSRFTFVHAADLHLDTPFEDIGRVPAPLAQVLRDASLEAWNALVELTIDRQASFLLLAGDVYDGDQRGIRAQTHFLRGLERLAERSIRVFLVLGNHDPLGGWSAIREWPPGVTVFGSDEVASVAVMRGSERLATVHGISYPRRDCSENLALRYGRTDDPGLHVGLLHANVGGDAAHALYSPCSVEDLRGAALDYWALGHIHERTILATGAPWIVYPGNLQGRSRKPSERGAKGAFVVEAEGDRIVDLEHVALDRVRYLHVDVDVAAARDTTERLTLLGRAAQHERAANPGPALLLDASLGAATLQRGERARLLDELRRAAASERPLLWWIGLRAEAKPPLDRASALGRDDLAADLARRAQLLAADPAARARFLERSFEPLLRRWVAEVEPGEADRLFHEAESLAFHLLTRNHEG
jgi:DNA repair exonuclease SbcCD nuclease subunit